MNEQPPGGDDPFSERDPAAAERARRRQEREQRRGRSSGSPAPPPEPTSEPTPEPDHPSTEALPAAAVGATEDWDWSEPEPRERSVRSHAGGRGGGSHQVLLRRLVALAIAVIALVLIVFAISKLTGGDDPQPVAEETAQTNFGRVLVPEGLTINQIADVAEEAGLKGSYKKAVKKAAKKFPFKDYGAKGTASLEGFLFPATYDLEKKAPASDLVAAQLEAFQGNFAEVNLKQAKKKNLTAYDVLIIASMIEEEVMVPEERALVSAVIYNRLSQSIPLGIDATIRYELQNYDEQLLQSELDADTPYNSRLHTGLPPTPIANPGLAAIEAAANPDKSDALYFVVKPGTCGEHTFTADEAEFATAEADYQAALAAEGGSPVKCDE